MAPQVAGGKVIVGVSGAEFEVRAFVGAVNTRTGHVAWSHPLTVLAKSGILATGDLVFYGDNAGTFTAANAGTGTPLWTFQATRYGTVGAPDAGPIAYATGGREFIAGPFGGNSAEAPFQESLLGDAVVAFSLPGPHYHGPHITYSDAAFPQGG